MNWREAHELQLPTFYPRPRSTSTRLLRHFRISSVSCLSLSLEPVYLYFIGIPSIHDSNSSSWICRSQVRRCSHKIIYPEVGCFGERYPVKGEAAASIDHFGHSFHVDHDSMPLFPVGDNLLFASHLSPLAPFTLKSHDHHVVFTCHDLSTKASFQASFQASFHPSFSSAQLFYLSA